MITADVIRKHWRCPKCGVGPADTAACTLIISNTTLSRTCKCGWGVEITEEGTE